MKQLTLTLLTLFIIASASAQVPQAMNYQAVARNSLGQIVPSQNIGVRFTIVDATGSIVYYQETHATTTNSFGLFTLAIGKGTAVSGAIAPIDWSTGGDKFLRVEIAPQGGTNYTIQGVTQLLSVPYALYAEKTKLIGGNAITITNGNTINANYLAGAGINISGNIISATAGNSWLLNGNTSTTATNFLGTTDNLPLNVRTNNIQRLSIHQGTNTGIDNYSTFFFGDWSLPNNPVSLNIYGKDISGSTVPSQFMGSIVGMNWSPAGGATNTLGRIMRLSQLTNSSNAYQFYDIGIDQEGDYFITEHGLSGTGGVFPKKMLQISSSNNVGINMAWSENPTANFHTKGTLRFEGVNTNNALTRIVAMDANGNVASRDASTLGSVGGFWVADANGIHNSNTGHVGIGGLATSVNGLDIEMMDNRTDGQAIIRASSNDTWETNLLLNNTTNNVSYHLVVGGSANIQPTYGVGAGGFGIVNGGSGTTIPLIISSNNFVGIGNSLGGTNNLPRARLHVQSGDVYIDQVGSGVIMKSPNGQCWRMTVSNAGAPVFTAITCP